MITFRFLEEATTNWVDDVNALLAELTSRQVKITREYFQECALRSHWLAAIDEDGDKIVGMGTLTIKPIPTGRCGYIDDVVTLPSHQGLGINETITRRLIEEAKRMRAQYVALSSKAAHIAANRLYEKLGMEERPPTNFYRLNLPPP